MCDVREWVGSRSQHPAIEGPSILKSEDPSQLSRASAFVQPPSALAGRNGLSRLEFDGNIYKREGGAAQGLVFAENQSQIAADLGIRNRYGGERIGTEISEHIRTRNETYANVGRYKPLQQFARVKFHGVVRLKSALVKKIFQRIPGVARLRDNEWKFRCLGYRRRLYLGQRMMWRRDDDEFIAVKQHHGQPSVGDRHGDDAEIHRVVDHRFENFAVIGALDIHGNIGVLLLELGENLGKDMQTCPFVGADDDLAAWHALGLADGSKDHLACFKCFFSIFPKQLARGGDGNFAAGAIEQPGADFFLESSHLR